MSSTKAVAIAVMLLALGCNKSEQTTTTTYEPPPPATTETQSASTTSVENPSALPPGTVPAGPVATQTSVSPVTKVPISLTPDFAHPQGLDAAEAPRLSIDAIEEEIKAGDVLLVDVRHAEAYQGSHAKGAVNIPLSDLPQRMGELPKEKYLVTYCT